MRIRLPIPVKDKKSPKKSRHFKAIRQPALKNCQSGTTAIEFAAILPVLLLMMFGIIEFSLIMFVSTVMESATNMTSRLGKTGYTSQGNTRQQQIIANLTAKTAGLLDPSKIAITTQVYSSFSNVNKPEPCILPPTAPCPGLPGVNFVDINGNGAWDADMGAAGLGNGGDVVVYTVSYPWKVLTPIISSIIGTTVNLSSRSVVRNEPFDTAAGGGR